jgi:predicted PurR-regulated permease PerM
MEAKGLSRGASAGIITIAFFSCLVALTLWVGPKLFVQLEELLQRVPDLVRALETQIDAKLQALTAALHSHSDIASAIPASPSAILERAASLGTQMVVNLVASGAALFSVLSLLLITPIVSFYFLLEWDRIVHKLDLLLPRAYAEDIREQCRIINQTLAGYLRGQLYVIGLLTLYYVLLLSLLDINYALVLAMVAGTLIIVPYVGTFVSVALALVVTYGQFGIAEEFWGVCAMYAVGQVLESQVLTPKVIGSRVGLHPLWILFGVLAGAVLAGFAGVLLAVPLTAVISVIVRYVVKRYLTSSLYLGK